MTARVISFLILTSLVGCSGDTVYVEIDNPEYRKVYIDVLEKKGYEYRIDEQGGIVVSINSIEKLRSDMKEYYDFRETEVVKLNSKKTE